MPPFTPFGGKSKTTIFKSESHKLHEGFTVLAGQTLYQGQPVQLDGATGHVKAWTKNDGYYKCIGYVVTPYRATEGQDVTVSVRGYMTILGISGSALAAGPVSYQSFNTADDIGGLKGFSVYDEADQVSTADDQAEVSGWALDVAGAANAIVRILVKG